MSTIRRNKLGFGAILLAVGLIIFILFKIFETDKFTRYLSAGISRPDPGEYSHEIYLKVTSLEYSKDTLEIIISTQWLYEQECYYKDLNMIDIRLQKRFIKKLKDCIENEKPMNISNDFFDELQNNSYYLVSIDDKLQQEFRENGYQYYIEDGWIKGYKWPRNLEVGTLPIAGDVNSWHILNNLIYFLQKEHIGVIFIDLSTDYCWGYSVAYF